MNYINNFTKYQYNNLMIVRSTLTSLVLGKITKLSGSGSSVSMLSLLQVVLDRVTYPRL